MPIFEYRATSPGDCPICASGFERLHKPSESELKDCPSCGNAVKRVASAPSLASSSPSLDSKNLEQHGFTQYRKAGKGEYEKTAGKGPQKISKDSL